MKINKIIFLLLLSFSSLFADLTEYQKKVLKICEKYGKLIGMQETLMAIAFSESNAGMAYPVQDMFLKPFTRSYGIMNVRLPTAKIVIAEGYVNFDQTDEYLLIKLIQDPEFNIAVAAGYLKLIQDKHFKNIEDIILAYNAGPGNVKQFKKENKIDYLIKTKKHLKFIKTLYENQEL